MRHEKYKIILNPTAGKGLAGARAGEIESLLDARGMRHRIFMTTSEWHAAEMARDAASEGYDAVIAAGGDGTVNEVVNGLMLCAARGEKPPAFGVLSVGRGNDFSYGADIPSGLEDCVEALVLGDERPMDVGRVSGGLYPQGRYFGNGIGVGFDTIVGLEAAKMRHVHGFMAYVFGAARTFIMYPTAPEISLAVDGAQTPLVSGPSHQISIMNGRRMGGTFFMAPHARNHDGLLELCMVGRMNRREMVELMLAYTKGSQAGHRKVVTGSGSRFSIEAPSGGLVCHADGETICTDGKSLLVECAPGALTLIYSRKAKAEVEARWGESGR